MRGLSIGLFHFTLLFMVTFWNIEHLFLPVGGLYYNQEASSRTSVQEEEILVTIFVLLHHTGDFDDVALTNS